MLKHDVFCNLKIRGFCFYITNIISNSWKFTKIQKISQKSTKKWIKTDWYLWLHSNRDESKLDVKMLKLQKSKNMSYEREINVLKEKYKIEICLKGENTIKIRKLYRN